MEYITNPSFHSRIFFTVYGSVIHFTKWHPCVASLLVLIASKLSLSIHPFIRVSIPCNIITYTLSSSSEVTIVVTKSTTFHLFYPLKILQYIHYSLTPYRDRSLLFKKIYPMKSLAYKMKSDIHKVSI